MPQFTYPWPAPFPGSPRGAGLVGEVRWQLGGRRGRVSFLSPTHTGLHWVGAHGSGRGRVAIFSCPPRLSGAPALLAAPSGEFLPCLEVPIALSCPSKEQKPPPPNPLPGLGFPREAAGVISWAGQEPVAGRGGHSSLWPPALHYGSE